MIKEIKYNGYSASPSDYECPDGDFAIADNMLQEEGELYAIGSPKIVGELPAGFSMFIHKTNSQVNYIFYNEHVAQWSIQMTYEQGELLPLIQGIDNQTILHVDAIGNTLLIMTEQGIQYFLWIDQNYKFLGDHIPDVELSFSLVGYPRLFSVSDESKETFEVTSVDKKLRDDPSSEWKDEDRRSITSTIMANVNKFVAEQTVQKGRFCFPFFVRYALRLYDGTLTGQSAPILMFPSTRIAPIVYVDEFTGVRKAKADIMLVAASIEYKINESDLESLKQWEDIVKGVEIYISKPIYPYDQNGEIKGYVDDKEEYVGTLQDTSFIGRLRAKTAEEAQGANAVNLTAEQQWNIWSMGYYDEIIEKWEDVQYEYPFIYNETNDRFNEYYKKRREDYISANSGMFETESPTITFNLGREIKRHTLFGKYLDCKYYDIWGIFFSSEKYTQRFEREYPEKFFQLPAISDEDFEKAIKDTATFYKLSSIDLEDLKTKRTEIEVGDEYLQSLVARETLPDDYLSHDKILAENSYTYNSRLHLAGIRRDLFRGFTPSSLFSFCQGWMRRSSTLMDSYDGLTNSSSITTGGDCYRYGIIVYVRELGDTYQVKGKLSEEPIYKMNDSIRPYYSSYLFYPNKNAHRAVVYYVDDDDQLFYVHDIPLKSHDFLNGAYAFPWYKDRSNVSNFFHFWEKHRVPNLNKLYVSDVNNPFVFASYGIHTIGSSKIIGMATSAKALSQGQFGQFPLYMFTEEGVWALEVSSTGSYSARQPITRDVCTNPKSITQLDAAVLFVTDRGIMMLSGSNSICISDILDGVSLFHTNELPYYAQLAGDRVIADPQNITFKEFLLGCRMIYDYIHQRIVVYHPSEPTNYVYSLESKQWGTMVTGISDGVNSYPDALATTLDGKVLNLSESDVTQGMNGLLITRPLKLDAPDQLKTIDTVIQRGYFRKGHVQSVLYGSNDLFSWHLIASSKDHFLRGFGGTPYKYFRIGLICNLDQDESIYGCTVQYTPRMINKPR